jgi:hypothetical protein
VAIVDGAERPAHDERGIEIEDSGEMELRAAADHELGRVAHTPLIRPLGVELTRQHIGGDGLIVLADRRRWESLPCARPQAVLAHEASDALGADVLAGLVQILPDAGAAVGGLGSPRTTPESACAAVDRGWSARIFVLTQEQERVPLLQADNEKWFSELQPGMRIAFSIIRDGEFRARCNRVIDARPTSKWPSEAAG